MLDFSASRSERAFGKREVPLSSGSVLIESRSRLLTLSLFIVLDLSVVPNLSHDSDFHVFGDVVTVSAILWLELSALNGALG